MERLFMIKFDKKFIIAAAAVIAILMFLLEPFQWASGSSGPAPSAPSGQNVTGTAVFNGTIRTYDPMLLLPLETNQSVIDALRLRPGVRDIQQQQNSWLVQTDTRDDVFPVASWLREMNVSAYSIANVAVNQQIEVETMAGTVNTSVLGGVVRVVAEPLLDADSLVTVSMVAVLRDNVLIDYSSATLLLQPVDILVDASVASLDGKVYTYVIPWAERNSVGNLSGFGDEAMFNRVDSVVFTTPLSVEQIMTKKQFSYVVYIDSGSATVSPSFDNLTELQKNFADTPFTLPPSVLTITTNSTPELNFTPEVRYRYTLLPASDEYVNSTLKLNVSALALGNRIVSLKRVSLPS
jgi:hypothetical protein